MDSNLEEMIKEGSMPNILKRYFLDSKRIKSFLSKEIIVDIEEIYLLYSALYEFNEAQFTQKTIEAIERCKDKTTFYFYLKKILDVDLTIKLKETSNVESGNFLYKITLEEEAERISSHYIEAINTIYEGNQNIDLKVVYQILGGLELICKLTHDEFFYKLYRSGQKVIAEYESTHNYKKY